ncbi:MAG TPA: hypothetical protein VIY96_00385, partial [Thermoanaerobaculia bacterium]
MSENWRGVAEEDAVRKLLQDAGPRPAPPETDLAAIRDAARAQWRRSYGAAVGRRRSGRWWLAVAAVLVLGAIAVVWLTRARPPVIAPTVATVERVTGGARWTAGAPVAAG